MKGKGKEKGKVKGMKAVAFGSIANSKHSGCRGGTFFFVLLLGEEDSGMEEEVWKRRRPCLCFAFIF